MTEPLIRRRERPSSSPSAIAPSPPLVTEPASYEVGYGRPPVATRFGGPRGNRSGRKKGSKSRRTILIEEFDAKVAVPGHGKLPKFQVAIRQLINQAAKGDIKAIMAVLKLGADLEREERSTEVSTADAPLTDHEQSVLDLMLTMAREAVESPVLSYSPSAGGDHDQH